MFDRRSIWSSFRLCRAATLRTGSCIKHLGQVRGKLDPQQKEKRARHLLKKLIVQLNLRLTNAADS